MATATTSEKKTREAEARSGGPEFHPEPTKRQRIRAAGGLGPGRERTAQFRHKVSHATGRIRESEYLRTRKDFEMRGYELVEDFQ